MEESGLVRQSAGSDESFRRMIVETAGDSGLLADEYIEPLGEISFVVFNTERYLDDLESAFIEVLTDKQIDAVRTFYASPLGQRVLAAEIAGSTPEVVDEIEATTEELREQARRDIVRTIFMQRLDAQFQFSEASARWFAITDLVVAEASLLARSPDSPAEALAAARQMIDLQREERVEAFREQTTVTFTRIYRDLSTPDLEAYVEFLEAGLAAEFYAAYYAADQKLMDQRLEEIRTKFVEYVRQKRA
jgi:hypothetical protein